MKREIDLTSDGFIFAATPKDCPLRPHFEALGQPPEVCVSGCRTKVQGAVPIHKCKHYQPDSAEKTGEIVTIECNWKQPT